MRIKRLDILRCVAVLLVITHHTGIPSLTASVGWVGVDLFFSTQRFPDLRPSLHRIQKLPIDCHRAIPDSPWVQDLPGVLCLVLGGDCCTSVGWQGLPNCSSVYLRELAFLQNYGAGLWGHTWSLAVEEHFYLALALLFAILTRFASRTADPFRRIPSLCLGVAIACLAFRAIAVCLHPETQPGHPHAVYFMTHTRVDSLFFGVLLGYLFHFRPEIVRNLLRSRRNCLAIAILSAALVSNPYFVPRSSPFCLTLGFTLLYLGFGGILLLCMEVHDVFKGKAAAGLAIVGNWCAYIGKHSYSIYLWHLPFIYFAPVALRIAVHARVPASLLGPFFLVGCCATGIVLARAIEFPALKLRERLFPMLQQPPAPAREPEVPPVPVIVHVKARAASAS